jgi:hypothetical protein
VVTIEAIEREFQSGTRMGGKITDFFHYNQGDRGDVNKHLLQQLYFTLRIIRVNDLTQGEGIQEYKGIYKYTVEAITTNSSQIYRNSSRPIDG